jgi:hypothetical protein
LENVLECVSPVKVCVSLVEVACVRLSLVVWKFCRPPDVAGLAPSTLACVAIVGGSYRFQKQRSLSHWLWEPAGIHQGTLPTGNNMVIPWNADQYGVRF